MIPDPGGFTPDGACTDCDWPNGLTFVLDQVGACEWRLNTHTDDGFAFQIDLQISSDGLGGIQVICVVSFGGDGVTVCLSEYTYYLDFRPAVTIDCKPTEESPWVMPYSSYNNFTAPDSCVVPPPNPGNITVIAL